MTWVMFTDNFLKAATANDDFGGELENPLKTLQDIFKR